MADTKRVEPPEVTEHEGALFREFSAPAYEDWMAEVERLLKGKPYDKAMLTRTHEGITLQPMYRKQDLEGLEFVNSMPGHAPFVRGATLYHQEKGGWWVAQENGCCTAEEFNAILRRNLARGQTAIVLPLDRASRMGYDPDHGDKDSVGVDGVSICTVEDLGKALDSVDLEKTPVFIQSGGSGMPYLGLYIALAKRNGYKPSKLQGAIAMDPLGELARMGKLSRTLDWSWVSIAEMTRWAHEHAPKLGTVWVHGEVYHDAGAHAVQELAFAMATGIEYLRALEEKGVTPSEAAPHMRFSFGLGTHFFMEVAKLRAARLLWDRILEAGGVEDESLRKLWMHGRTSRFTKTFYDPYVNMLRATTEAFSGITGGVESLHVGPFDEELRDTDEFSRRIARNVQIILREEAHLEQITDPAGGSWYVEKLTDEVATQAWELLQTIEEQGGMAKALQAGQPQEMIARTVSDRAKALATRKDTLIGTNKYPNPTEKPLSTPAGRNGAYFEKRMRQMEQVRSSASHKKEMTVLEKLNDLLDAGPETVAAAVIEAAAHGATVGEIVRTRTHEAGETVEIEPIPQRRASEAFEALRRTVEQQREIQPGSCKVFLATLDRIGKYMPRFDFAASFFEVGGFEVIRTEGHDTPEAAAQAAIDAKAHAVVIVGLDDAYTEGAATVARKVKEAFGDAQVILAGLPSDEDFRDELIDAGVDTFIHLRSNLLEELTALAETMGVEL